MNKIFAISSRGKSEKSLLDLRFGKCENIFIYNAGTRHSSVIENPYKNSDHSGVKLVEFLKKEGVSVIITGEIGPQVNHLLEKEKLQVVLLHEEKIKIEEVLSRLKSTSTD